MCNFPAICPAANDEKLNAGEVQKQDFAKGTNCNSVKSQEKRSPPSDPGSPYGSFGLHQERHMAYAVPWFGGAQIA